MSTQQHDEALHPRETTGKFATKPVTEALGGLDAFGYDDGAETELSSARATAVDKAVLDGRLSPAARDMAPGDVLFQYAQSAHDGNELAALRDLGLPAVAVLRKRWTPCNPEDHDTPDEARDCESGEHGEMDGDETTEILFPDNVEEAVDAIRETGTSFAASGGGWASNPDGSTIVNYRTGEREEVSAHLYGMHDDQEIAINDKVG